MVEDSAITVKTEDAFQFLLSELQPGEWKTHQELADILRKGFKGIGKSQCAGIIYRGHANQNAILKKEGSRYRLLTENEKNANPDGMEVAQEKLRNLLEEIENIPGSQFETYDSFRRYKELLELLEKGTRV